MGSNKYKPAAVGKKKKLWSQWFRLWYDCWCRTGWFKYFYNWWSPGIFTQQFFWVHQNGAIKKEKNKHLVCGKWKRLLDERGQQWMARLIQADKDYSNSKNIRFHVCQLRGKSRGSSEQQNWTDEDWRNAAWPEIQLIYTDYRVRTWSQQHDFVDPTCIVSIVQAGGGGLMVRQMFTSGSLLPIG